MADTGRGRGGFGRGRGGDRGRGRGRGRRGGRKDEEKEWCVPTQISACVNDSDDEPSYYIGFPSPNSVVS